MKTITLLRHGKSSWDDPALPDHDRPLAPRGRHAAAAVGRHLRGAAGKTVKWDRVLCSTAWRAVETLDIILGALDADPPVERDRGLYLTGAGALLDRLRALPDGVDRVLLVGHNPDLQDLARRLAGSGPPKLLARLSAKFPTAALAVLTVPAAPWSDLNDGTAKLAAFIRPKDLESPGDRES